MSNNIQNNEQDRRLVVVEEHIATTNAEMGAIKADIKWLKWYTKLIISTQVGIIITLIGILFNLIK